ncbi:MAG: helical backbone metal receptor [Polyangiales bacterium]
MLRLRDDRERELVFATPPRRVVSLVPSDTYTVAKLAGVERLVGRTDYCEEPRGEIERVPSVGGTKDARVDAIRALAPDLVIANQEENTRGTLEALAQAGIPVFVVFPKRVDEGVALVARLARILGVAREPAALELLRSCRRALAAATELRETTAPARCFCPIWVEPGAPPAWWMTIHGATYISDALDLAGAQNVFADRERRYPLAADLGRAAPTLRQNLGDRDVRYPRVTPEEIVARQPELVLLPDEPHPFTDDDARHVAALDTPAARAGKIVRMSGKDDCWYGAWSAIGIPRLRATVDALRGR